MDPLASVLFVFGLILLVTSWLLLLQLSFQSDYTWGLTALFVPPLAYLYGFFVWDKARDVLYLAGAGCVLLILSFG